MTEYERDEKYRWLANLLIWIFAITLVLGLGRILWLGIMWIGQHVKIV